MSTSSCLVLPALLLLLASPHPPYFVVASLARHADTIENPQVVPIFFCLLTPKTSEYCQITSLEMVTAGRSVATDPGSYTNRDLLLFTQLLHTLGLITPEQVKASDRLDELAEEWYLHKSTALSRRQGQFPLETPPTATQFLKLYENLLADHVPCANTTDLANKIYFTRVGELEKKIGDYKAQFHTLLGESSSI